MDQIWGPGLVCELQLNKCKIGRMVVLTLRALVKRFYETFSKESLVRVKWKSWTRGRVMMWSISDGTLPYKSCGFKSCCIIVRNLNIVRRLRQIVNHRCLLVISTLNRKCWDGSVLVKRCRFLMTSLQKPVCFGVWSASYHPAAVQTRCFNWFNHLHPMY